MTPPYFAIAKEDVLADIVREITGLVPRLELMLLPPDISFAQYHVLERLVKAKGHLLQRDLHLNAFETSTQASGISMLLRRMREAGWIKTEEVVAGRGRLKRRRRIVKLLSAGRRKRDEVRKYYRTQLNFYFGDLSDESVKELYSVLGEFRDSLGQPRQSWLLEKASPDFPQ